MTFKPGQSGNPGGKSPSLKMLSNELRKQLAQNPQRLKSIVDKLISDAEDGNMVATAMIFNRIEGAVPQTLEVTRDVAGDVAEANRRIAMLAARFNVAVPLLEIEAKEVENDIG